jgi:hypothetical protein
MASSGRSVPRRKWYQFETKDIITNTIALAALIVSGITAYNQFVLAPELSFFATNLGLANNRPYIDVVVSNEGNKPGTVMSVTLYPTKTSKTECGKAPGTNWKTFASEGKVEPTQAAVYPIKAGESVVRRISFESEELSTAMGNSPIEKDEMASNQFCIEIGTLDTENCPVWTPMYVGRMWFYPKGPWSGWSDSSEHLPVKAVPPKKSNDPYCQKGRT